MDVREELKSSGAYPVGPVSAWPKERNDALHEEATIYEQDLNAKPLVRELARTTPTAPLTVRAMAKNLARTGRQALRHGKVSSEVREERYNTCKACPFFNAESKRCNDCGCFMEAKTWVGGDPDTLCPQKKWSR